MCGCLLCAPYWESHPQLRHVPWLGIKLVPLWFAGPCSIHWATPARAWHKYYLAKQWTLECLLEKTISQFVTKLKRGSATCWHQKANSGGRDWWEQKGFLFKCTRIWKDGGLSVIRLILSISHTNNPTIPSKTKEKAGPRDPASF